MILSQFFPSTSSNSGTSTTSADVSARVTKVMQAQNTGAAKLNAALTSDTTTLSGLGKLLNALSTFQSLAQPLSSSTASASSTASSGSTVADPNQLSQKITALVNGYNSLNAGLTGLQQGDLKAEGSITRIQSQISRVLNLGSSGTVGGSLITLGSIGITTQKNGDLTIDPTKLQSAISANPSGVAKLFSDTGTGIADNLVSQVQSMIGANGSIPRETASITKDISALTVKKNSLAQALTNEANALTKLYSQQNSSSGQSGSFSLFDFLG